MNLVVDAAYQSTAHHGEELCGDHVEIRRTEQGTIFVLSDGLGSGVKANILSTLTSKIAIGLIEKNLPLEEIIETLIQTLPVCKVRDLAYSTLAILQINHEGHAHLVEFDTPAAVHLRNGKVFAVPMQEREVKGRLIREGRFTLEEGDCIFLASDGVTNAGIGALLDFGLGWDGLAKHIEDVSAAKLSLHQMIEKVMDMCLAYYLLEAGDDFTILGAQLRKPRHLTIMTGPPVKEDDDALMAARFLNAEGRKVICGGTTAQLFARESNREMNCGFNYVDPDLPPVSEIEGIDLVTEGLLTLNKTLQYLREYRYPNLPVMQDGASMLTRELLLADDIKLLVGQAINEAHQNLKLPVDLGIRTQVVQRLLVALQGMHKRVSIEWF